MGSVAQEVRHVFIEVISGSLNGARGILFNHKQWCIRAEDGARIMCVVHKDGKEYNYSKKPDFNYRVIEPYESLKGVSNGENN